MIYHNYNNTTPTWSIAQGIRQGTFFLSPKIKGNDEEKEGAACVAGKLILPMQLNN